MVTEISDLWRRIIFRRRRIIRELFGGEQVVVSEEFVHDFAEQAELMQSPASPWDHRSVRLAWKLTKISTRTSPSTVSELVIVVIAADRQLERPLLDLVVQHGTVVLLA